MGTPCSSRWEGRTVVCVCVWFTCVCSICEKSVRLQDERWWVSLYWAGCACDGVCVCDSQQHLQGCGSGLNLLPAPASKGGDLRPPTLILKAPGRGRRAYESLASASKGSLTETTPRIRKKMVLWKKKRKIKVTLEGNGFQNRFLSS